MPDKCRFIFVGGADRSGTTLLQRILTAHTAVAGGPQLSGKGFNLTHDLFSLYGKVDREFEKSKMDFFTGREELKDNFASFYLSFFNAVQLTGKKFISEKTTRNIEIAPALLDFFKDAIFINIYRDGRDVLASHLEVAARSDSGSVPNTGLLCLKWNNAIQMMFRMQEDKEYKERFISVRYEELITSPEATLRMLFDRLGIPFESHLLRPERIENAAGYADGIWHRDSDFKQSFNAARIGKWRSGLSMKDRAKANMLMRDNLVRLGYGVSSAASLWKK